MKFREFEEEVEVVLEDACRSLGYKDVVVEVSRPPSDAYGDLASAVPIRIAKQLGKKPGEVAIQVASSAMEKA